MLFVESEALLPCLEEETFAHFQEEALDLADDGGFQVGFRIAAPLVQSQEFQNQRLLEQIARLLDDLPLPRKPANPFLVAAEGQALVESRVELALEFA